MQSISPASLRTLAIAMGPGVLIMIGVTIGAASFYKLSRAEHARIRAAIELSRAHAAGNQETTSLARVTT